RPGTRRASGSSAPCCPTAAASAPARCRRPARRRSRRLRCARLAWQLPPCFNTLYCNRRGELRQYVVLDRGVRVPKQVDHAERRGRIAEALWTVAERDGIAAATVRHVAAEAGVSVGMVQHYFSTKDEMLLFALRWVGEDFGAQITARVGAL